MINGKEEGGFYEKERKGKEKAQSARRGDLFSFFVTTLTLFCDGRPEDGRCGGNRVALGRAGVGAGPLRCSFEGLRTASPQGQG